MGTETVAVKFERAFIALVKLNNPLMGTETRIVALYINSSYCDELN